MANNQNIVVPNTNLYRNGSIINFSNGEQLLLRDKVVIEGSIEDDYYTLGRDEDLDFVSWKFYSDFVADASKLWWVIADANNIENPLDLEDYIGTELLIPNWFRIALII